jgi:two-component system, sensor histidine kinase
VFLRSRSILLWAAAAVAGLAFIVAPLLWVQRAQGDLLNEKQEFQNDSVLWFCYQLEREHTRFTNLLREVSRDARPDAVADLTERYEVFVSRIGLLQNNPSISLLKPNPQYGEAMASLNTFVTRADTLLAAATARPLTTGELSALWNESMPLVETLNSLTQTANHAVLQNNELRSKTIRSQGMLVAGLAAGMCLVLLGVLTAAMLNLRRKNARQRELEALTTQLRAAQLHAEAANRGKSVFIANMSHEIRTPFNGLLGMLTLLADTPLEATQRSYLQTGRDSALHLLNILNDILDISTIESGNMRLSPTAVELLPLLHDVETLMRTPARNKGLELKFEFDFRLPQWVHADPTRLRQILFNLISNAIKFTEKGHVSVIVQTAASDATSAGLRFTVRDTGIGMDKAAREKLFSRFFQADDSATRRFGGTGLGLEISRNLARLMGGDITFESELGVGTTFVAHLPIQPCAAPAVEPTDNALKPDASARSMRILVAEDHPINRQYLEILLKKQGHDAVFCENGQLALDALARQPFDLVLMDVHMPVMDGLTATRAIRAMGGPLSEIAIVALTADAVAEAREKALDAGVDAVVAKPVQPADLKVLLKQFEPGHEERVVDEPAALRRDWANSNYGSMPAELTATESTPAINEETFRTVLDMLRGDRLHGLLKKLFGDESGAVRSLLQALQEGNVYRAGQEAHKLKSTSMLMGFTAMVKTAATVEFAAMHTGDGIKPGVRAQFERDVAATRKMLEELGYPVP